LDERFDRILLSKQVVLQGYSMLPHFWPGRVGILFFAPRPCYAVGDIVVFRDAMHESIVVHRIIHATDECLVTKGDNNFFADPPVRPTDILGKVEKCKMKKQQTILQVQSSMKMAGISAKEEKLSQKWGKLVAKLLHSYFFVQLFLRRRLVFQK
jgi:signal peptidase I